MNNLKALRKKHRIKQKDLAKLLNISQPNYSNFENGKTNINLKYAQILASFYDVPLTYIIENNNNDFIFITKDEFEFLKEAQLLISKINKRNDF